MSAHRGSSTPISRFSPHHRYNVFLFTILGFALLTVIYLCIFPSDRDHLNKVMQKIKIKKGAWQRAQGSGCAVVGALPCDAPPSAPRLSLPHAGLESKNIDRKISQQGGSLAAVVGGKKGKK